MRSMTGFGQATADTPVRRVTSTVRGVNHRHLDVVVRLRDDLREIEPLLRERIATQIRRGRVELAVDIGPSGNGAVIPRLDREALRALRDSSLALVAEGLLPAPPTTGDLLRIPEAFGLRAAEAPIGEVERRAALEAAERAIEQFVAARETEGRALRRAVEMRLHALAEVAVRLRARRPAALAEGNAALRRRLHELLAQTPLDEGRFAQEIAVLADRSDVAEELDRLDGHLAHAAELLEAQSQGRRLDFLAQEIMRELNTLGAKCRDAEMVRAVLDGKTLCEQLREQVQNVE